MSKSRNPRYQKLSERKVQSIIRRLRRGMSVPRVAEDVGVDKKTVYRIQIERASVIAEEIDFSNTTEAQLREKCVEFISGLMANGMWDHSKVSRIVAFYGVQRFEVANFAIAAAERVARGINPTMLSAVLEETIHELRRLAYHCEKDGRVEASISARRALGQMIVSLSKNNPETARVTKQIVHFHQAQPQQNVSAKMGAEELIALGWVPPPPLGLPSIADDESALNNEFEEREEKNAKSKDDG